MTAEDLHQQIIEDLKREQQHNNDNIVLISDAPESYEDELRARRWFAAVLEELIASLESGDELHADAIQTALRRCEDGIHLKAPGSLEGSLLEPVRDQINFYLISNS